MSNLITDPNLVNADNTYAQLIDAHEGLSDEQRQALNARLILVLINHIGDDAVIQQALAAAKSIGQND